MPVEKSEYFSRLNYTLANEDTSLELAVLPQNVSKVVSVVGSGARLTALLANNPKELFGVDLVQEQIQLAKMRLECHRQLSHEEFLTLWGYPPFHTQDAIEHRIDLITKVKLEKDVRNDFEKLFHQCGYRRILQAGKWEKTIEKVSLLAKQILGEKLIRHIFESSSLDEQVEILQGFKFSAALKLFTAAIGNASFFNFLLYKGAFPQRNIKQTQANLYELAFTKLLHRGLARKNYFLQLVLLGGLEYAEGNPIECDKDVFAKIKASQTKVVFQKVSIENIPKSVGNDIDFLSISDVPSYFTDDLEKQFLQILKPCLSQDGIILLRSYMHVPDADRAGYDLVNDKHHEAIEAEKTQLYQVEILQNKS